MENIKGTNPKFYSKMAKKIFFVEKASSGMGEMRPKIGDASPPIGAPSTRTPLMGGQRGG